MGSNCNTKLKPHTGNVCGNIHQNRIRQMIVKIHDKTKDELIIERLTKSPRIPLPEKKDFIPVY